MSSKAYTWNHCCKVPMRDQKSPPSSLLPQAQKENQGSVSVNAIMRSEEHGKSAPCYKKPQKTFFSFCLWPHPNHTHNLSTMLLRFLAFPFLTLPLRSQPTEGPSQTPGTPAAHLRITMHSSLFWTLGEALCCCTAKGDANSGCACIGPNSDLRHPHNSCCKSHVCTFLTAGYAHLHCLNASARVVWLPFNRIKV